jgi:lysophospholipase L1-like esterase
MLRASLLSAAALFSWACCLSPAVTAADALVKAGDQIVFLGDSITQQGDGRLGYVSRFRSLCTNDEQFRELKLKVHNAGISGNRVPDLEARLEKILTTIKPNVVVIYIGINDVWHSEQGKGTSKEDFEKGLTRIVERIQSSDMTAVLCTPTVIGEKKQGENKLDAMLDEYSDIIRKLAKDKKAPLIDLRAAFFDYLKEHNKVNAERLVLTNDRVHLNKAGNLLVAKQMAAALLGESGAQKIQAAADAIEQAAKPVPPGEPEMKEPAKPESTPPVAMAKKGQKMLRHVVLVKFKKEVTPEQVAEVTTAFAELPKKIREIKAFEWGTDNSPEGLAQGYTHCFLVTFQDEAGRAAYLPHAEHQKFVELVKPRLESVLVVDYWTP